MKKILIILATIAGIILLGLIGQSDYEDEIKLHTNPQPGNAYTRTVTGGRL